MAIVVLGGLLWALLTPAHAQQQGMAGELFVKKVKISEAPEYAIWLNELATPRATDTAGWMWDGAPANCGLANVTRDPNAVLMGGTVHIIMSIYSCVAIPLTTITITAEDEAGRALDVEPFIHKRTFLAGESKEIQFDVGPLPDDIGHELRLTLVKTDTQSNWEEDLDGGPNTALVVLEVFRLLNYPSWAASPGPWGDLPWYTVMKWACTKAQGHNTDGGAASRLTEQVYFDPPLGHRLFTWDGLPHYGNWDPGTFNLNLYLSQSNGMTVAKPGQCTDSAHILQLLVRALGASSATSSVLWGANTLNGTPIQGLKTDPVNATGSALWIAHCWNYHEVSKSSISVWDACLRVNSAQNPILPQGMAWSSYVGFLNNPNGSTGCERPSLSVKKSYVPTVY